MRDDVIRTAKDERELERMLAALDRADLEELLRQAWGRRLYYRLVFKLGNLESASFEPEIKDGVCAAMHMARNEGLREMAAVLARQAQQHFPDLWTQMLQERVAAEAEQLARRGEMRAKTTTTEGDE